MFSVQWVSQVKILNLKPCVLLLGLELASHSYQWILQEESYTIDLLSIQIDKYQTGIQIPLVLACSLAHHV